MDRGVCGALLLALCWSLGAPQSLKIKVSRPQLEVKSSNQLYFQVVDGEDKVKRDFSDSSAAFQERSYLLPAKQRDAIKVVTVNVSYMAMITRNTVLLGISGAPCSSQRLFCCISSPWQQHVRSISGWVRDLSWEICKLLFVIAYYDRLPIAMFVVGGQDVSLEWDATASLCVITQCISWCSSLGGVHQSCWLFSQYCILFKQQCLSVWKSLHPTGSHLR